MALVLGLAVIAMPLALAADNEDGTFHYLLPGVAHTRGVGGIRWLTSLGVFNPGLRPVQVGLVFRGAAGLLETGVTVPPGSVQHWDDAVAALFGVPQDTDVAGTVEVVSAHPVVIWGSTYHASGGGRLGQPLPVLTQRDGMGPAGGGVIAGLPNDDAHRVNLAAVNLGGHPCQVEFRLISEVGEPVGDAVVLSPGVFGWVQVTDVLRTLDPGRLHSGFVRAQVRIVSGRCRAWVQASVIDNRSGVSILVPAERRGVPDGTFLARVVDEYFVVRISDPAVVALAREIVAGRQPQRVILGELRPGEGGFNHDPTAGRIWSWHLDPATVRLVDAVIELCDGLPSYVEEDLAYWLSTVGKYCPWLGELEREILYPWPIEP